MSMRGSFKDGLAPNFSLSFQRTLTVYLTLETKRGAEASAGESIETFNTV